MKLLITIFMFSVYLIANPIVLTENNDSKSCQKYKKINKYNYLTELVRSSNFNFKKWKIEAKQISLLIDEDNETNIIFQIYISNEKSLEEGIGLRSIGWFNYDIETAKLFDITNEPIEIIYDDLWKDVMTVILSDKKQKYLVVKEKIFLYTTPNKTSKSKKFLIQNDCVLILDDTQKEWYEIYFYHSKWKTNTIMWLKRM